MAKKQLWMIIAGLIITNCLTVAFFLTKQVSSIENEEVVATVGKVDITRQEWLNVMEDRYGRDVLKELVDYEVIEAVADKYNIDVSDSSVERELLMVKTMYGAVSDSLLNGDEWRKQIKSSILLEEILTKDVIISDDELMEYYEQNKRFYAIPTSYHVSQIIVNDLDEANQALEELKGGSNFATLAMERSIEEISASQGGDIGFIRKEDDHISPNYFNVIKQLKPGKWSEPFQTEEGYVIIMLHEQIDGRNYQFKDVKDDIRRRMAIDQMEGGSSADVFWNEVSVEWFYGE